MCPVRYTSRAPLSKWVSGILERFLYTQNLTGPTQVTQCVQWSTQNSLSFQHQMEPPHPNPDLSECTHIRPCDVSWPIISTSMRSRDWGSQSWSRLQPHEPHTSFKGTAHLKQHSNKIAIFSSGMKIFKIAFQHVVGNSCIVPIAPFSATNFNHMTLFWRFGGKHLFLQF